MAAKKTNGKRQSPSVERQIALALVRLKECVLEEERAGAILSAQTGQVSADLAAIYETASTARKQAIEECDKVLADNGYGELESIASRVAALELQLKAAMDLKQYKDIAPLGAALERAKKGLAPLPVTEKKPKATTEPRKPRTAKAVASIIAAFGSGTEFKAANGEVVTSIKPSATGKQCSVQFADNEWVDVDPAELVSATEPDQQS